MKLISNYTDTLKYYYIQNMNYYAPIFKVGLKKGFWYGKMIKCKFMHMSFFKQAAPISMQRIIYLINEYIC